MKRKSESLAGNGAEQRGEVKEKNDAEDGRLEKGKNRQEQS